MANAQIRVDFLENRRGGYYLVQDGYKYSAKTKRNDRCYWRWLLFSSRCYWRCVDRQCPATLTTLNNIPVWFGNSHNHPGDTIGLAAFVFVYNVKNRCREEADPISSMFDEELGNLCNRDLDDDVAEMIEKIPTFNSCKSSLYGSRAKLIPKLPATQGDTGIDFQGLWKETSAGERFLLCERIMIFATDDNLRRLADSSSTFGDGTFYSYPGLFSQLYSIEDAINKHVRPEIAR